MSQPAALVIVLATCQIAVGDMLTNQKHLQTDLTINKLVHA